MAKKGSIAKTTAAPAVIAPGKPSALVDPRVDLIYLDPAPLSAVEGPFNSNRNYEVFWGETKEKRAFVDRHASTQAYIEYMRPRCVQLARVLKKTAGSPCWLTEGGLHGR